VVNRLPKGAPSVLLIQVGPEHGDHPVTPVKTGGAGRGQVRQERKQLRSPEYVQTFGSTWITEVHATEERQVEDTGRSVHRAGVTSE